MTHALLNEIVAFVMIGAIILLAASIAPILFYWKFCFISCGTNMPTATRRLVLSFFWTILFRRELGWRATYSTKSILLSSTSASINLARTSKHVFDPRYDRECVSYKIFDVSSGLPGSRTHARNGKPQNQFQLKVRNHGNGRFCVLRCGRPRSTYDPREGTFGSLP